MRALFFANPSALSCFPSRGRRHQRAKRKPAGGKSEISAPRASRQEAQVRVAGGFTLLELLTALAMFAVMATLAFGRLGQAVAPSDAPDAA